MFSRRPTDSSEDLLVRLGSLTARARELAETQRSRVELAVALQRGMLPSDLPSFPGARLAVRYEPANHGLNVGGDWYDAFSLPGGRIGMSIGDVQGHNIEAAAFMGQVRVALRALASVTGDPGELLGRTNDLLISLGADLFATCTFLRLDPAAPAPWSAPGPVTSPTSGPPPTAAPASTTARAGLPSVCCAAWTTRLRATGSPQTVSSSC